MQEFEDGERLASLSATSPDAASRAGAAATLQLVDGATPAVVQANRQGIESLQRALAARPGIGPAESQATLTSALRRPAGVRPTVFVQIANPRQAPLARQLAQDFEAAGYATAQIETVGEKRAPARPEVRSHGGSDPAMARWCLSKLSKVTGMQAVLQNLRDVRPDNDVFEIWFDAALCAPDGRQVPVCGKA